MNQSNTIEYPVSAGGVVYRISPRLEIVLCGRKTDTRRSLSGSNMQWHLPKGTPETGETLEETALREVKEETGYEVITKQYLQEIQYTFQNPQKNTLYKKTVHFYLMIALSGDSTFHDSEFDEVKWMSPEDALMLIGYDNEKDVIAHAMTQLAEEDTQKDRTDG